METPAKIKHHPIHPILVAMPIGLWVFSLFSDIVYYVKWGGPVWASVAYFTLAGGIVTALMAAVPGFIDLLSITEPKLRKIGIIHMIMNLVVVAIYVVDLFLRRDGRTDALPIILSAIGVLLLAVSGWLGAELVHHYGVTVAERPGEGGPRPA